MGEGKRLILIWIAIIGGLFLMVAGQTLAQTGQGSEEPVASDTLSPGVERLAQAAVSADHVLGIEAAESLLDQLELALRHDGDRLARFAVVGFIKDAEAAVEGIDGLAVGERWRAVALALEARYRDGIEVLEPDQRRLLRDRLGWCGRLALVGASDAEAPGRSEVIAAATRGAVLLAVGNLALIGAVIAGSVALGWFVWALVRKRLRAHYHNDDLGLAVRSAGAFALWIWSFLLVPLVAGLIVGESTTLGILLPWLWVAAAPLLWRWLRSGGQSSAAVAKALGWHRGAGWWREIGAGLLVWLAWVPVGGLLLVIMTWLVPPEMLERSQHPIAEVIGRDPAWWMVAAVVALAVVWAPLVEETLFRGLLFHHLRSGTGPVLACFAQGLFFAAIHPQGWVLIPVLTILGAVLAAARWWRGSLIAPITAHAVHNGVLVGAFFIFS